MEFLCLKWDQPLHVWLDWWLHNEFVLIKLILKSPNFLFPNHLVVMQGLCFMCLILA